MHTYPLCLIGVRCLGSARALKRPWFRCLSYLARHKILIHSCIRGRCYHRRNMRATTAPNPRNRGLHRGTKRSAKTYRGTDHATASLCGTAAILRYSYLDTARAHPCIRSAWIEDENGSAPWMRADEFLGWARAARGHKRTNDAVSRQDVYRLSDQSCRLNNTVQFLRTSYPTYSIVTGDCNIRCTYAQKRRT